jgi:hypothetical protein
MNDLKTGEIYSFKVTSGEEVVGKIQAQGAYEIVLDHAVSVAMTPQGVQMIPSMFTANPKGKITINTKNVTMVSETSEDVIAAYTQAVTGISTPSKKIITG